MALAVAFVILAAILCAAAVLALLGTGQLGLSGSEPLERDGLARGKRAPGWTLPGHDGAPVHSPPARGLQFIVFADHSLKSFPSVLAGLKTLAAGQHMEIVVLTRGTAAHAWRVLDGLGLVGAAVVDGSPALYARYNVRVMPFAIIVGQDGRVRGLQPGEPRLAGRQAGPGSGDPGRCGRAPRLAAGLVQHRITGR